MQKHWVNSFRDQTSCRPLTFDSKFQVFSKVQLDFWSSSQEALSEILNPNSGDWSSFRQKLEA